MKRLITVLLAVAFLATGALVAVASEKGEAEYTFEAKNGNITFPHEAHQGIVEDCKTCHHEGVEAGACRTCHTKEKGDVPTFKSAAHKMCKSCHKAQAGPTKCSGCHVK